MYPELPTTLPPSPPPNYPDGLVEEIPHKRAEILGLDMDMDIDYCLVRKYPRRRHSYSFSCKAPVIILMLGLVVFVVGYITGSIILGAEEFQQQVDDNVFLLKSGHQKFLIIGEDTVTISPDSMAYTDQEYVQYNFTMISQQLQPVYGRYPNISMEKYKIVFDDEIQEKTANEGCSNEENRICLKVTKFAPFGRYEVNKIVIYYTLKANGQLLNFKRTFNVEIDEDKRTAMILEHVLKKVFKEQKKKTD